MMEHRAAGRFAGGFAAGLLECSQLFGAASGAGSPAGAQAGKGLIDPNMAAESDLQSLPAMTPAIVKGMIERAPSRAWSS